MEKKELGRYLSYLKIETGMTYDDIDRSSGVPKSTISRLFNDKTASPSMDAVVKIFEAMGGSMAEFEAGTWKKEPAAVAIVSDDKVVSLESHIAMMDAYEKRLTEKDAYVQQRLAEKDAEMDKIIQIKDDYITELLKEKKHWRNFAIGIIVVVLSLFAVDLFIPSIGWFRWQLSRMMESIKNAVWKVVA